jgi:hypothetical protein
MANNKRAENHPWNFAHVTKNFFLKIHENLTHNAKSHAIVPSCHSLSFNQSTLKKVFLEFRKLISYAEVCMYSQSFAEGKRSVCFKCSCIVSAMACYWKKLCEYHGFLHLFSVRAIFFSRLVFFLLSLYARLVLFI